MSYYENQPWSAAGQATWDHQTPPARSGASSAIPREEPAAFAQQLEEVDRAIDNLVKSGKMFGMSGRRESLPSPGPARMQLGREGRMGPGGGSRPHSVTDFGDARGPHQSNLQNFYASQRHQSSRGSNEAEQMMQAKRRMAAQRERELRNYHQEQQFNRTVLAELSSSYSNKPERTMSPGGGMSEDERRDLIARQRSALYGEGPFAEAPGYVDETGTPRPGLPGHHNGPVALRGHSPMTYEYGRTPPAHPDAGPQPPAEGGPGSQSAGPNQRSRANSTSSPQSNPPTNKGVFEGPSSQQVSRTSTSSPGGSPGSKPGPVGGPTVAPIGTRPSASTATSSSAANPALNKRSTTPLPSPLSHGYSASGSAGAAPGAPGEANALSSAGDPSNPPSAAEGGSMGGISGRWGSRSGGWPNKSGLGVQASVWG